MSDSREGMTPERAREIWDKYDPFPGDDGSDAYFAKGFLAGIEYARRTAENLQEEIDRLQRERDYYQGNAEWLHAERCKYWEQRDEALGENVKLRGMVDGLRTCLEKADEPHTHGCWFHTRGGNVGCSCGVENIFIESADVTEVKP